MSCLEVRCEVAKVKVFRLSTSTHSRQKYIVAETLRMHDHLEENCSCPFLCLTFPVSVVTVSWDGRNESATECPPLKSRRNRFLKLTKQSKKSDIVKKVLFVTKKEARTFVVEEWCSANSKPRPTLTPIHLQFSAFLLTAFWPFQHDSCQLTFCIFEKSTEVSEGRQSTFCCFRRKAKCLMWQIPSWNGANSRFFVHNQKLLNERRGFSYSVC